MTSATHTRIRAYAPDARGHTTVPRERRTGTRRRVGHAPRPWTRRHHDDGVVIEPRSHLRPVCLNRSRAAPPVAVRVPAVLRALLCLAHRSVWRSRHRADQIRARRAVVRPDDLQADPNILAPAFGPLIISGLLHSYISCICQCLDKAWLDVAHSQHSLLQLRRQRCRHCESNHVSGILVNPSLAEEWARIVVHSCGCSTGVYTSAWPVFWLDRTRPINPFGRGVTSVGIQSGCATDGRHAGSKARDRGMVSRNGIGGGGQRKRRTHPRFLEFPRRRERLMSGYPALAPQPCYRFRIIPHCGLPAAAPTLAPLWHPRPVGQSSGFGRRLFSRPASGRALNIRVWSRGPILGLTRISAHVFLKKNRPVGREETHARYAHQSPS